MIIRESLERDHDLEHGKLVEARISMIRGQLDKDSFLEFVNNIRRHIYIEEEIIFPDLIGLDSNLKGPISGLEMEHASLWMLMDRILEETASGEVRKSPKYLDEMERILAVHNAVESTNIYPKIKDERVPNLEQAALPEGWICRRLRKSRKR
ncbi:MAG: hemerythrin domain-containing protein [Candidatus Thermoplasmatota archaeon]|nr:hemerythrin domain-containing protein [Candidatus Thermoplasmatota archaeon]MCL5800593.1 hemerythrin domain-containing protein [Candidatus Thermoplasmatota archaeon]